ncbi:hypothetical protein [Bradyrhizobium sp. BR 10261]|uniref:hypothetical protein n=1 Tax=Bradyrhizobium sp. BR 10261 TaxID=2749992 RepID=UPI001C64D7B0|nr:hypothetical protein [Bradyrhizobium sp. BR 10261]MBW7965336.1 hypothetical protein [Bradyrhizobium sp. BR 10261]
MPAIELDAKTLKERSELCLELLKLRKKHVKDFDRIDAIKERLKAIATTMEVGFKEVDQKLGKVSVSPEKAETFGGDFPEIDVRKLQALPDKDRQKLYDDGLIVIRSKWSKPYYGQVTVTLF